MFWENEVVKENAMLEGKYQELLQEIEEKSLLMQTQISKKGQSATEMEQQITSDLEKQQANVKEQIELYKA